MIWGHIHDAQSTGSLDGTPTVKTNRVLLWNGILTGLLWPSLVGCSRTTWRQTETAILQADSSSQPAEIAAAHFASGAKAVYIDDKTGCSLLGPY